MSGCNGYVSLVNCILPWRLALCTTDKTKLNFTVAGCRQLQSEQTMVMRMGKWKIRKRGNGNGNRNMEISAM